MQGGTAEPQRQRFMGSRPSLDPRNPNRVLAGVRLREDTPVRVDSTAATESQGITGGSYIQISAGTPSKPLLKEVSKETLPVIKVASVKVV